MRSSLYIRRIHRIQPSRKPYGPEPDPDTSGWAAFRGVVWNEDRTVFLIDKSPAARSRAPSTGPIRPETPGNTAEIGRQIHDKVMLSERPEEANARKGAGHSEGHLIIRSASGSAIATTVDRTTRFVVLDAELHGDMRDRATIDDHSFDQ